MKKLWNSISKGNLGYIIGVCLWAFVGCSLGQFRHNSYFDTYIDEFKWIANFYEIEQYRFWFLSINFADLQKGEDRTIGICYIPFKHIDIDSKFWYNKNESELRKKAVIFHEISHCICYRKHVNSYLLDTCPMSIMHSYLPSDYCLKKHWTWYIKELFNNC